MLEQQTTTPARHADLVFGLQGEQGQYVVKDARTEAYYTLGDEEFFLLMRLDGKRTPEALCADYEACFGQPLSRDDLDEFVQQARSWGFLQTEAAEKNGTAAAGTGPTPGVSSVAASETAGPRQSILYWRVSFFDPDRLFTWLAPKLRFFWTRSFVLFSAGCILAAVVLVWLNWHEWVHTLPGALRWETALLVWLTLMLVTTCHEFAHGLTCKHHGGEVHELGFLLIFFLPGFYCNVSDAWLFHDKAKRLWVTLAGGYFELFLWSWAVFAWRLTVADSLPHHLAWGVASVCGVRVLFNFNPLIKLDGYYLLSDGLAIPNLRQRAFASWMGHLRAFLWGAPRPAAEPRSRFLLTYGLVSWLYSVTLVVVSLALCVQLGGTGWGLLGFGVATVLGVLSLPGLFQGLAAGEVTQMLATRYKRTAGWLLAVGAMPALLYGVQIEDRVSGSVQVRPATRVELRAPVAGFLHEVYGDEGDRVYAGAVVARLEIPDLASRLAQKRAEVREVQARLRLLEAGPRPEEVLEQRRRVERAQAWRNLAKQDLARAKQALEHDLARLEEQIAQHRAEREYAQDVLARAKKLMSEKALTEEQYRDAQKQVRVAGAQEAQAQAQRRARQALGTHEAEAEQARRQKELADAQAILTLLEAGTRPEEIDAERARLARLQEEARYLERLQNKLQVASLVSGVITTPRLKEKVGQYVREGELICLIEETAGLEAEISVAEQDVARVEPGQVVELKARALPYQTFLAQVDRIAPTAGRGEVQSSVIVYCRLAEASAALRPGMTGYARISTGRRSLGEILSDRTLRYLRTEFWW
ncbi:MAG: HlyD family efflux transporter periplasmic adaptor subunit [Gemmataceae bacterium]|nr:HlyD family efflux transporter periplasmic adaptor subunit [Gemmataceae bacterium]